MIGPVPPTTYTRVPGNVEVLFDGDGNPESLTVGGPADEPFQPLEDPQRVSGIRDGFSALSLEPGLYVLEVFATWDEGDGVLTFGIEAT